MLLNNKKFFDLTHIIFTLSLFLVSRNLSDLNIFFWIILYVFAFTLYVKNLKINFIILFLLLCASLYIQLFFFEFVLAKEFFVKIIGILLVFRFLNIKTKNHLFSFNIICLFISVLNLTESQDLINSLLSTVLLILTISNFYLSNQTTLIEMDLKNMIKYLGFGLGLIPVIAIFYLIIPRTDITLNLFNASKNNLGIPDSINLGSFEQISESDEKLFVLINDNFKKNELYFRVKVFDQIDDKKSWRPSSGYFLIRKFPNSIQTVNFTPQNKMYDLIIENYKNSWLPVLKNTTIISDTQDYSFSIFNQTYRSKKKIESKKVDNKLKKKFEDRFLYKNLKFSQLNNLKLKNENIKSVIFDLGYSYTQIKDPKKGLSFDSIGNLNMKMGLNNFSAEDVINKLDEKELEKIFKFFGEEKESKFIARNIVKERIKNKIDTQTLVKIIDKTKRKKSFKTHSATKVFQALRILVNKEISELIFGLINAAKVLKKDGLLTVVTFHSLEDKIVKYFFKSLSEKKSISRYVPVMEQSETLFELIEKKAIVPSEKEINENLPSRSAKLRYVKKRTDFYDFETDILDQFKNLIEIENFGDKL